MKHVRWITRRGPLRYEAVEDCGCLRWRLVRVDGPRVTVVDESTGGFYDNMPPAAPTWRKHHFLGMVELVRAVRAHASRKRAFRRSYRQAIRLQREVGCGTLVRG